MPDRWFANPHLSPAPSDMKNGGWAGKIPWRGAAKLVVLIAVLVAANQLVGYLLDMLNFEIRPSNEDMVNRTIILAAILYTLLLAIPFVPGVEIGVAMIVMFGPPIVFLVYVCTVSGMVLAFLAGRLVPFSLLVRFADELHLTKMSALLADMSGLSRKQRLEYFANRASGGPVPYLIRYRYVALAVAINIPGNFLIGGGGGIALFAGFSRLYAFPGFLLTIALAVAPVPLAVLFLGSGFLNR